MVVIVLWEVHWSGNFVVLNEGLGIAKVPFRLPSVLGSQVPLPLNKEGTVTQLSLVSNDSFNFVFFISVDKIQGWTEEVGTMFCGFLIGC